MIKPKHSLNILRSFLFLGGLSIATLLSVGLVGVETAQAGCGWLDITCKDSGIRQTGRDIDPTNPNSSVGKPIEQGTKFIQQEIKNCFQGGCDPTRKQTWDKASENMQKAEAIAAKLRENMQKAEATAAKLKTEFNQLREDYQTINDFINNPQYGTVKLFQRLGSLTDQYLLNGYFSRNFGHVTNKYQLRADLEKRGIVIYGYEISHEEYINATNSAVISVAAANPAPLSLYFEDLGEKSYLEILNNIDKAINDAPQMLQQRYGNQLQDLKRLEQIVDPIYIANSLATYISTGKTPPVPKIDANLDKFNISFGILTYNRGEKIYNEKIPLPNTHQPYILITLPQLKVEVDNVLAAGTQQYDETATLRGITELSLLEGTKNSEESRNNLALAVNLYRNILGREPEGGAAEGLASRLANGSTLEKERQIMANSPESRNNLANLYRTILGREPEGGAVDGLVSRLANGSTLEKERQIVLNSEEAQNRHRLPNCASTYNPLPYRVAGTPAYDGRVGRIAFMNNTEAPVTVKLYHPDAPNRAFGSYGISPGSNSYLGDSNVIIGTDWGIQVNDGNTCIVGLVSDGGSRDGQSNFQTWPDRLR